MSKGLHRCCVIIKLYDGSPQIHFLVLLILFHINFSTRVITLGSKCGYANTVLSAVEQMLGFGFYYAFGSEFQNSNKFAYGQLIISKDVLYI